MDDGKERLRYNGMLTLLIVCALFLAARSVYLFLADPQRFPVNTVKIAATYHHITHKQLEAILEQYSQYSFFSLPVTRLTKELNRLEWSDDVYVERLWPDTLKIKLVEKTPIAIWNNAMLSDSGEVFNEGGSATDDSLPHLSGPKNQHQEVLQVYQKMSKILTMYGLHAAALKWRKNAAWELVLSNGVQLRLGKQDLEMRVHRFCKAWPAVFADKPDQLVSVDLRYPRGMAVQWKK
ncbi:cell division protein FtsQ/DivIB [Legionella sp. CNM-4043-24]|uniref:cell division protein FtsQ/DivIB n=1 Tax=Legionella sp. CNM-4043-24 TaxID=3421646 RepID=UPI00403AA06B